MKEITIRRKSNPIFRGFGTKDKELKILKKNAARVVSNEGSPSTACADSKEFSIREMRSGSRTCAMKRRRVPVQMMERHRDSERFRHQGLNATIDYLANRVPGYNSFTFSKTKIVKMQLMIDYICHLENYISDLCTDMNLSTFSKQSFLSSQLSQDLKKDMKSSQKIQERKMWNGALENNTNADNDLPASTLDVHVFENGFGIHTEGHSNPEVIGLTGFYNGPTISHISSEAEPDRDTLITSSDCSLSSFFGSSPASEVLGQLMQNHDQFSPRYMNASQSWSKFLSASDLNLQHPSY